MQTIKSICRIFKYNKDESLSIYDYFVSKTYDSVYQTDLINHVINGVSPRKEESEAYERNFIKKCMLLMGKRNFKILKDFFGDEETMISNMLLYMRDRINKDGLSKIIQDQINDQSEQTS